MARVRLHAFMSTTDSAAPRCVDASCDQEIREGQKSHVRRDEIDLHTFVRIIGGVNPKVFPL